MSKCGECKLGCNRQGILYCEENLGYEQCIDKLQDVLYDLLRSSRGEWVIRYNPCPYCGAEIRSIT